MNVGAAIKQQSASVYALLQLPRCEVMKDDYRVLVRGTMKFPFNSGTCPPLSHIILRICLDGSNYPRSFVNN